MPQGDKLITKKRRQNLLRKERAMERKNILMKRVTNMSNKDLTESSSKLKLKFPILMRKAVPKTDFFTTLKCVES